MISKLQGRHVQILAMLCANIETQNPLVNTKVENWR